MATYLKQPVNLEAEARQFTDPAQAEELASWAGGTTDGTQISVLRPDHPRGERWVAYAGDWIIREPAPVDQDGEATGDAPFYVVSDEHFQASFQSKTRRRVRRKAAQ